MHIVNTYAIDELQRSNEHVWFLRLILIFISLFFRRYHKIPNISPGLIKAHKYF